MDAENIQKWNRCKEVAEDRMVTIDVTDRFILKNKAGHTLGALYTVAEVFAYLRGFAAASTNVYSKVGGGWIPLDYQNAEDPPEAYECVDYLFLSGPVTDAPRTVGNRAIAWRPCQ